MRKRTQLAPAVENSGHILFRFNVFTGILFEMQAIKMGSLH